MTRNASSATRVSPRSTLRRRLDQFGIGLAGLCMVHCIATLMIVSALGIGGQGIGGPGSGGGGTGVMVVGRFPGKCGVGVVPMVPWPR